jgi:hypothetical protein
MNRVRIELPVDSIISLTVGGEPGIMDLTGYVQILLERAVGRPFKSSSLEGNVNFGTLCAPDGARFYVNDVEIAADEALELVSEEITQAIIEAVRASDERA